MMKSVVRRAALRAFLYNLVLEAVLWALVLFAIAQHTLVAVLSYEFLLYLLILLTLGVYGITAFVFVLGILMELFKRKKEERHENPA